jgi:hypothetical protein
MKNHLVKTLLLSALALILAISAFALLHKEGKSSPNALNEIMEELAAYPYTEPKMTLETNGFFNLINEKLSAYLSTPASVVELRQNQESSNGFYVTIQDMAEIAPYNYHYRTVVFGHTDPKDDSYDTIYLQSFTPDGKSLNTMIVEKNYYTATSSGAICSYDLFSTENATYLCIVNKKHNYESGIDFYKLITLKNDGLLWRNISGQDRNISSDLWQLNEQIDDGVYIKCDKIDDFVQSSYAFDQDRLVFNFKFEFADKAVQQEVIFSKSDQWELTPQFTEVPTLPAKQIFSPDGVNFVEERVIQTSEGGETLPRVSFYLNAKGEALGIAEEHHYQGGNGYWLNDDQFLFDGYTIYSLSTGMIQSLSRPDAKVVPEFTVPNPNGTILAGMAVERMGNEGYLALYLYDIATATWTQAVSETHSIMATENFIELFWDEAGAVYYQRVYDDTADGVLNYHTDMVKYDLNTGEANVWQTAVIEEVSPSGRYVTLAGYQDGVTPRQRTRLIWDLQADKEVFRLPGAEMTTCCYRDTDKALVYWEAASGQLIVYDLERQEILQAMDISAPGGENAGYKLVHSRQGKIYLETDQRYIEVEL